jgi:Flp pilus assembly protein TadG
MTRDANSFFRRLVRDERGVAAVLVATALVALVGMGALVVDVGYFFYARSVVQASANASALAGAQEIGTGGAPLAPRRHTAA